MYLVKFKISLFLIWFVKVSVGSVSYNLSMWCFQSSSNILCWKNTLDKLPLRELCRAKLTSVGQVGDIWWSFFKWSILDPNAGKSKMDMLLNRPSESTSVILVKRWLNSSSNFEGSLCRGVCGHLFPLIRNPNSHYKWNYVYLPTYILSMFFPTPLESIINLTQKMSMEYHVSFRNILFALFVIDGFKVFLL